MHITRVSLRIPGGTLELILVPDSEPPTATENFVETEGTELPSSEPIGIRSCRSNVINLRKSA